MLADPHGVELGFKRGLGYLNLQACHGGLQVEERFSLKLSQQVFGICMSNAIAFLRHISDPILSYIGLLHRNDAREALGHRHDTGRFDGMKVIKGSNESL